VYWHFSDGELESLVKLMVDLSLKNEVLPALLTSLVSNVE